MKKINIKERRDTAVENFKSGYNCAQSVFLAYSDLYGVDVNFAKKISAPFGGGMGRLREMCGAASGMFMICGLQYPADNPADKEAKTENYAAVQRCAAAFKAQFGDYICANLIKVKRHPQNPAPSDRNAEYYAKRPCAFFVAKAADIIGRELNVANGYEAE